MTQRLNPSARTTLPALVLSLQLLAGTVVWSQSLPWSRRTANSVSKHIPAGSLNAANLPANEGRELGILLDGMTAVWQNTADGGAYQYVRRSVDSTLTQAGSISLAKQVLLLYRVTQDAKYYGIAASLHKQLASPHGDDSSGVIPADDLYTAEPFYAEYAEVFQEPRNFAEITQQLSSIHHHGSASDPSQDGWYMMALVDSLPHYPMNDPGRAILLAILNRTAAALARSQDAKTALWPRTGGNAEDKDEASTACRITYALQKGVRLGYLPQTYSKTTNRAWQAIMAQFAHQEPDGSVTITGTSRANDPGSVGAFLLASTEMELAPTATRAHGQRVVVDAWFNSQQRRNAAGQKVLFHYKWNDESDSGFSFYGSIFRGFGAELETLDTAPTAERLKHAQYYLIASPDIPVKNPHPNYAQPEDAEQIAHWVKQGGILVLMENDPPNADIEHFNLIADRFGLHFNNVLSHHVVGDDFKAGQIHVAGGGELFHNPHTLYMKDTCTLSLKGSARALLEGQGDTVMATVKYGKGTVFAVVDPWLYNEYTDHRKLLPEQDNFAAGKELVRWLLEQTPGRHNPTIR